jgi:hypothetical protein
LRLREPTQSLDPAFADLRRCVSEMNLDSVFHLHPNVGVELSQRLHGPWREDDFVQIWLHHSQITAIPPAPQRPAAICASPLSRPSRKSLTLALLPAILAPMRYALQTVAVVLSVLCARRDLLLEILALRYQLGVLARSDRRFRISDRLFWLLLRRVWPRWRQALVLVQPATVARWHRRRFHGSWSSRSRRRPGRPRIDADVWALIRRMSTENRLWGAPRIHGELLKLGFTVSERTVSRIYLTERGAGRKTWRTFLANHFGDLTCESAAASSGLPANDDVVDTGLFSFGLTPTSATARASSHTPNAKGAPSVPRTSLRSRDALARPSSLGTDRPGPAAIRQVIAGATGQNVDARRLFGSAMHLCAPTVSGDSCAWIAIRAVRLSVRPAR